VVNKTARLPIGEEGDRFVVVVTGVLTGDGDAFVIAAQSLASVERSSEVVITLLAVGYPLVLLVVGVTSYWLTGRALKSVENIRKRVATITGSQLDGRVPVPQTNDEVSRLAATMNDMLARLEAAAGNQRRFVADASHELAAPSRASGRRWRSDWLTPTTSTGTTPVG
jgi:signal transduction histidine kinase